MSTNSAGVMLLFATSLLVCGVGIAEADVTIQEKIAVEGSGLMSMASMSGTSTTSISGKHARMESDLRLQSGFARMFARGAGQSTEIVRLDDDTIYELDPKKKRYRETSLAARRAELAEALEQATQAQQANPTAFDDSQCDWSEPKVKVDKAGAKQSIAGLSAAPVSIVARQSCKDRKSGAVCEIALSLEEWMAPGSGAAQDVLQFRTAFAQQMGIGNAQRDVVARAEILFGRYQQAWSLVANEMRGVKGFPVKTSFAFGLGGASCNGGAGAGSAGAPSPAAVASQIFGAFGRKKAPQDDAGSTASAPAPAGMSGMVVPIRVTSELDSINSEPLSASTFEVPADFKKITSGK
ncbi:MAG: hypothetical protein WDO56_18690 [Gammaproteobacteria bacterium]